MKLVRVQGTTPQLNEFIGSCCMDGRFDLEPATRYMSESLGYGALNEENPHTAIRDQIETMAKEANMELHEGQQHSDPVDAEGRSYLSDLLEKIDDLCAERKVLLDQKKLCEDGIEQYSHFTGLKVNVDDILDCAHVKIRFGFLPTEGYNKLMNNYGDDPYILFTPCNQTKAGYWGVYMTPREHALETDGIFSMLYFEPVHVPGAAGSPARSSSTLKRTSTLSTRASRTSTPALPPCGSKTPTRSSCCTTQPATTRRSTTCAAWPRSRASTSSASAGSRRRRWTRSRAKPAASMGCASRWTDRNPPVR